MDEETLKESIKAVGLRNKFKRVYLAEKENLLTASQIEEQRKAINGNSSLSSLAEHNYNVEEEEESCIEISQISNDDFVFDVTASKEILDDLKLEEIKSAILDKIKESTGPFPPYIILQGNLTNFITKNLIFSFDVIINKIFR